MPADAGRPITSRLLLLTSLWLAACGGPDAPPPSADPPPHLSYIALTLEVAPTWLGAVYAEPTAFVVVEGGHPGGLALSALAVSGDGRERSPVVRLMTGHSAAFGPPVVADGALLVAGLRDSEGADASGSALEIVRWVPGEQAARVLSCPLVAPRGGALTVQGGELVVVFEDVDASLRGFRVPLEGSSCPEPEAVALVMSGPLPSDYRLDWLDDQLALSGQWGDTYAIQLFGSSFEPLRRLRLASGGALHTNDLSFTRLADEGWVVVYGGRVDGAPDVYVAALGQLRAGPLEAARVVATAETERRPALLERGGVRIAHWAVTDLAGQEWIELAGVLSGLGSALPGGEVVWRRPVRRGALAASVWTESGLLRVEAVPTQTGATLTISPYRPSFWNH